jgi:hypothetical protein
MVKQRRSRWKLLIALAIAGLLSGCYYPYGYYPWGYPYPQPYAWSYPGFPGQPNPPPAPPPAAPPTSPPTSLNAPPDEPVQRTPLPSAP